MATEQKFFVAINYNGDFEDESKKLAKQFSELDIRWGLYLNWIGISFLPSQLNTLKRFVGKLYETMGEKAYRNLLELEHETEVFVSNDKDAINIGREVGSAIDSILYRLLNQLPYDKVSVPIPIDTMEKITKHVQGDSTLKDENNYIQKLIEKDLKN